MGNSRQRARTGLSREFQAVFQDPYSSLNPMRTIGQSLAEPLITQDKVPAADVRKETETMLVQIGLSIDAARRYPGEFSGGQLQRISIARALMSHPSLVVCDEPLSSLDMAVQSQVLNLLCDFQDRYGCSYLFITHDLTVVRQFADRVLVLYGGLVMEAGPVAEVCNNPQHPYTQALLAAVPVMDPDIQRLRRLSRQPPVRSDEGSPRSQSGGQCSFADRCPHADERCRAERPALRPSSSGARVACHYFESLPPVPDVFDSIVPNSQASRAARRPIME
jgi:oligopeptide/dipeptide ABC transporter ATP-binding protein